MVVDADFDSRLGEDHGQAKAVMHLPPVEVFSAGHQT